MDDVAASSPADRLDFASDPIFRAVFDASPRAQLLMAADPPRFTMLAVNPAHARAFATTPEALVGHGVFEVFPADPSPAVGDFVKAIRVSLDLVMTTGQPQQMPIHPISVPSADGLSVAERYVGATNVPILGAGGRITHILSAVQDLTGEVLERRSEEARALLMREVDHRARNALTVVQSFLQLTDAPTVEAFRDVVVGRVEALARAQTSLARRKWEGALLGDVIADELASLAAPEKSRLVGPPVLLRAEDVQAMSMAVHELATNARKYGALSTADGRLTISWTFDEADTLTLTWREEGGPPVVAPSRAGFGSRMILQLAQQLGGDIRHDWRPTGLVAELTATLQR
jgi:two-component sensor histidine kinase